MVNKQGVGLGYLVSIVIGIVIMLLIFQGPLHAGYTYTKERIFPQFIPPSTEEEFTPYVPGLTADEIKVLNSVNALACGINIVATGKFDLSMCKGFVSKKPIKYILNN